MNEREQQVVDLQPYESSWHNVHIVHRPYFQTPFGYTTVPNHKEAVARIRYEALVMQVELMTGGELSAGSARRLANRGWGLSIKTNDAVRFLSDLQNREKQLEVEMLADRVMKLRDSAVSPGSGGAVARPKRQTKLELRTFLRKEFGEGSALFEIVPEYVSEYSVYFYDR